MADKRPAVPSGRFPKLRTHASGGTGHQMNYTTSNSGVKLFINFRDNLIIDRYAPELLQMRGSKVQWMRSENSEDAITWNVFRTIRQIDPALWFPMLMKQAFPAANLAPPQVLSLTLWPKRPPPLSLTSTGIAEGRSEIDVAIETEAIVWFIEAKYKSDISTGTKHASTRHQIIRNIDVGSWFAGVRDFYFSLLVLDEIHSPLGTSFITKYRGEPNEVKRQLAHRHDEIGNVRDVGLLTWVQLANVLRDCGTAGRPDESGFCRRALAWLADKSILPSD